MSVRHFFIKLQNIGNLLLFVPLMPFLAYYLLVWTGKIVLPLFLEEKDHLPFWIMLVSITTILFFLFLFLKGRLRRIALMVGLGEKLERAGSLYVVRIVVIALLSTLVSVSLFFLGDTRLGFIYGGLMLVYYFTRPTPVRVARHLRLRGDEKEMVESRGEAFR